ncbi:unnamed protein product [Fraxinus pennsylvanica]|uniref:Uncharacterized protein n=1 Tax=Fraxinus pennsylvanica TaxID=56036 RepID=A0AAD2DVS4_9LAMI|nr:unnamed protein product [Fraxinus pennsylvanica]
MNGNGTRRVRTNKGVPRVKIWVGNLIKHFAGILNAGELRQSRCLNEFAGRVRIKKEASSEHSRMDLFEVLGARAMIDHCDYRMVCKVSVIVDGGKIGIQVVTLNIHVWSSHKFPELK